MNKGLLNLYIKVYYNYKYLFFGIYIVIIYYNFFASSELSR